MGFLDKLKAKKEEPEEKKEKPAPAEGKYDQPCGFCGELGTEKKWLGQYWHKKCLRNLKKKAKGMV